MSYSKRQLARKKQRLSTGNLSKEPNVPIAEIRQAEHLMRYGKEWVKYMDGMTPYEADPRKIIGTGMNAQVTLAKPLERIEGSKESHPTVVSGYGTVDIDGWVFKAKITAMGVPADHLLTAVDISAVGTLREIPKGYQFSVRAINDEQISEQETFSFC